MSTIAPTFLLRLVRDLMASVPVGMQWPIFTVALAIYVYLLVLVFSRLWCWLDFQLARGLRRIGLAPLWLQYELGGVVEAAPKWAGRIGAVLVLGTVVFAAIDVGVQPATGTPLHWFRQHWLLLLRTLL